MLRFAGGFDHVAVGFTLDKFDGVLEGVKFPGIRDDEAGGFHLLRAEVAIELQLIRIGAAADNRFALFAQPVGQSARSRYRR